MAAAVGTRVFCGGLDERASQQELEAEVTMHAKPLTPISAASPRAPSDGPFRLPAFFSAGRLE
jgi:hypothetical protein